MPEWDEAARERLEIELPEMGDTPETQEAIRALLADRDRLAEERDDYKALAAGLDKLCAAYRCQSHPRMKVLNEIRAARDRIAARALDQGGGA